MNSSKKKKASARTKWALLALLVGFALIVALSIMVYHGPEASPSPSPDQYFGFSDEAAYAENASGRAIKILVLHFNLTAVGGDANHLVIFADGMMDPNDYYYPKVSNGTTLAVEITFTYPIISTKGDRGFPVAVKLSCDETVGKVTVYVPEEDVII